MLVLTTQEHFTYIEAKRHFSLLSISEKVWPPNDFESASCFSLNLPITRDALHLRLPFSFVPLLLL